MNASEFVKSLADCAPSVEGLGRQGYPPGLQTEFHNSYIAQARDPRPQPLEDPLLDLLISYDASTLTIGMVTFSKDPFNSRVGWIVGKDEADFIIIDVESGEIQVRETGREWYIASRCAATSSQFLDAMVAVACFASRSMLEPDLRTNGDEKHRQAAKCADLAGGPKYVEFYKYALGCYDGD